MSDDTLATRLDDLEVRYAFQDETIRQLDEVIQDMSTQMERLKNEQVGPRAPKSSPGAADQVHPTTRRRYPQEDRQTDRVMRPELGCWRP